MHDRSLLDCNWNWSLSLSQKTQLWQGLWFFIRHGDHVVKYEGSQLLVFEMSWFVSFESWLLIHGHILCFKKRWNNYKNQGVLSLNKNTMSRFALNQSAFSLALIAAMPHILVPITRQVSDLRWLLSTFQPNALSVIQYSCKCCGRAVGG